MSITLGSYSGLPDPSGEDREFFIRGTSYSLSNGTIQHDNINSTVKQKISLSFTAVTESVADNLIAAALACLSANKSYTDIRGDTYTVTLSTDRPRPKATSVAASSIRYNVTFNLEEV